METQVQTVGDFLHLAQQMNEEQFLADFPYPVLIEKVGGFPHQHPSLLSGTVLVTPNDIPSSAGASTESDILAAKVFALRKKASSIGTDVYVGRAPTNDVMLTSPSVSKSHAQVTPVAESGDYHLVDMFSSNGTFLNGQKIHPFEKHQLRDHDEIALGPDYLLIYYSPQGFYELLKSLTG
jgi:hypothetical protein